MNIFLNKSISKYSNFIYKKLKFEKKIWKFPMNLSLKPKFRF